MSDFVTGRCTYAIEVRGAVPGETAAALRKVGPEAFTSLQQMKFNVDLGHN
jgi:hypothetical protein